MRRLFPSSATFTSRFATPATAWPFCDRSSKVRTDAATRGQVIEAVNLFRAKVVDVSTESLTIEATGTPAKLEAFLRVLEPYGIRELVQSGVVSLSRGPRGIGVK